VASNIYRDHFHTNHKKQQHKQSYIQLDITFRYLLTHCHGSEFEAVDKMSSQCTL